ncbi:MAG: helix-turn-helix domain-containing protein, partial [Pseudonocardia sp.]|nr:helix-turn-helix domain-containing protein [Pseudonocardia sp.]
MGADGPADASLGAQVRQARMATGTSLRGLARQLGVSPATLSQIETGRTGLSVHRLSRIAEALGLTVPQILDVVVAPPGEVVPPEPPRRTLGPASRVRWREYGPLDFDP